MHKINRYARYEPSKNRYVCKVTVGAREIEWATDSYPTALEWSRHERELVQRIDSAASASRSAPVR